MEHSELLLRQCAMKIQFFRLAIACSRWCQMCGHCDVQMIVAVELQGWGFQSHGISWQCRARRGKGVAPRSSLVCCGTALLAMPAHLHMLAVLALFTAAANDRQDHATKQLSRHRVLPFCNSQQGRVAAPCLSFLRCGAAAMHVVSFVQPGHGPGLQVSVL